MLDSSMIHKIEKAKQYAQQPERFKFQKFLVTIKGNNNDHTVQYENGQFQCDCDFFRTRGVCSHTMALEELLKGMLPEK